MISKNHGQTLRRWGWAGTSPLRSCGVLCLFIFLDSACQPTTFSPCCSKDMRHTYTISPLVIASISQSSHRRINLEGNQMSIASQLITSFIIKIWNGWPSRKIRRWSMLSMLTSPLSPVEHLVAMRRCVYYSPKETAGMMISIVTGSTSKPISWRILRWIGNPWSNTPLHSWWEPSNCLLKLLPHKTKKWKTARLPSRKPTM